MKRFFFFEIEREFLSRRTESENRKRINGHNLIIKKSQFNCFPDAFLN